MIIGVLRKQARYNMRPQERNHILQMVSSWPLKECNLESSAKLLLEHNKAKKNHTTNTKLATYNENSKEKTRRYIRSQPLREWAQRKNRESTAPALSPLVNGAAPDQCLAALQQRSGAFLVCSSPHFSSAIIYEVLSVTIYLC